MKFNSQTVTDLATNKMPQPYYRFDGTNDQILVSADANLSAGFCDFSQLVSFKTPISTLFGGLGFVFYRTAGTNLKEFFRCSNSQIEWYSQDGTGNASYVTANLALDADTRYTIVAVADRSDTNHLYINGREVTIVGANSVSDAYSISYSADLYIGNYASQNYATGELYAYQRWNKAITADEAQELSSGASVPYKYKGANQTDIIDDGDFENGSYTDTSPCTGQTGTGWDHAGNTGGQLVCSIVTGSGFSGNAQRVHRASGEGSRAGTYDNVQQVHNFYKGKTYRVAFKYRSNVAFNLRTWSPDNVIISSVSANTGDATEHTFIWTPVVDRGGIYITTWMSGVGCQHDGDYIEFDDFSVVQIGAVAEYDGSGAGEKIWGDKSGNDLHGTVTGATLENTAYDSGTEYEEGTWTPVYAPATDDFTSLTMDVYTATYIKIGNKVTIQALIRTDGTLNVGTGTGDLQINGLPFNCVNGAIALGVTKNFASGKYPFGGTVESSYIILTERAAIGGTTNECAVDSLSTSGAANQNQVVFSCTYLAS